jgi:hypothetical protein
MAAYGTAVPPTATGPCIALRQRGQPARQPPQGAVRGHAAPLAASLPTMCDASALLASPCATPSPRPVPGHERHRSCPARREHGPRLGCAAAPAHRRVLAASRRSQVSARPSSAARAIEPAQLRRRRSGPGPWGGKVPAHLSRTLWSCSAAGAPGPLNPGSAARSGARSADRSGARSADRSGARLADRSGARPEPRSAVSPTRRGAPRMRRSWSR